MSPVSTPPPAPPVSPVHLRARWSEESGVGLLGARCKAGVPGASLHPVLGFFAPQPLQLAAFGCKIWATGESGCGHNQNREGAAVEKMRVGHL